jgi:hypothetical protein
MASNAGQALLLELRLRPGEPISGWVCHPGDPPGLAFHGWIELMIALQTLRRRPRPQEAPES